jgi:hypothetical protein
MGGINPEQGDGEMRGKIIVRLKVDPDGRFVAWEKTREDVVPDPAKPRWTGTITKDLHIAAVRRSEASCQGVKVENRTEMKGAAFEGRNGDAIEISGREATCPSMGCKFAVIYRLTRRS